MVKKRDKRQHSGPPWQPAALLLALFGLVLAVHGFSIAAELPIVSEPATERSYHP